MTLQECSETLPVCLNTVNSKYSLAMGSCYDVGYINSCKILGSVAKKPIQKKIVTTIPCFGICSCLENKKHSCDKMRVKVALPVMRNSWIIILFNNGHAFLAQLGLFPESRLGKNPIF